MSVEAISARSIAPSFGGEFSGGIRGSTSFGVAPDLGGTHVPGFNNNAFSETFKIPTPSLHNPEGGKAIHDISPFKNIEILWQAQPTQVIEPVSLQIYNVLRETSIKPIQTDDIEVSDRVIQEISEIDTEPEIEISIAIPSQTQHQEIIADAKQAIKVEDSLVATGVAKAEAHAIVLRVFEETEDKKGLTPTLKEEKLNIRGNKAKSSEFYFEHDANADEARKNVASNAVENVTREIADGEREIITGHDIADHMPDSQPEVNSEIAKEKDGSFENFVNQLESTGKISSIAEAGGILDRIINDNHAVRTTNVLTTQEATESEVEKVLSGKEIVIFQK